MRVYIRLAAAVLYTGRRDQAGGSAVGRERGQAQGPYFQLKAAYFACTCTSRSPAGHSYHLGCYDNQYDGLPAASARTCRACPPPGPSGNSPARRRSVPVAAVATPAVKRKRRAEDAADSPVDDDLESSPLRPFRRRRLSGAEEDLAAARRYSQAQEEYTRLSKLHKQEAERDEGRSGQDLEQLEQDDQEVGARRRGGGLRNCQGQAALAKLLVGREPGLGKPRRRRPLLQKMPGAVLNCSLHLHLRPPAA